MSNPQVPQFAADAGPGREFADPRRVELMQALERSLHREIGADLWAFLWLADVTKLQGIVAGVQRNSEVYIRYLEGVLKDSNILREWSQSVRSRPASAASSVKGASTATPPQQISPGLQMTSTTSPSAKSDKDKRSAKATDNCRKRDGNTCVVTRAGPSTEVAHIFPFAMRKFQYEGSLNAEASPWRVLRLFWPDEKVQAWYDAVAGPYGTEVVQNLFCLAPSVHDYHTRAFFALKPIQEDTQARILTVQFYWMSHVKAPYRTRMFPAPSILPDLHSCSGVGGTVKLWDVPAERKLCSGDEITMNAKDNEGFLLPNYALLELQWHLHRIVAMCGGAEAIEERYGDDDDDFFYPAGGDYSNDDSMFESSRPTAPSSPLALHQVNSWLRSAAEEAEEAEQHQGANHDDGVQV